MNFKIKTTFTMANGIGIMAPAILLLLNFYCVRRAVSILNEDFSSRPARQSSRFESQPQKFQIEKFSLLFTGLIRSKRLNKIAV